MTGRSILCLIVLLLVTAGTAEARFTDHLDDLEAGLIARRADFADDPDAKRLLRQFDKALKLLAKENLALGYHKEVKAAARVAKILEKKMPEETALHADLATALASYREELDGARVVLAAVMDTKRLARSLKRADRFLEKADLATTRAKELKKLGGAAKALNDYIGAEIPTEATWVVKTMKIAAEGLDLDGDDKPDNALKDLLVQAGVDGNALLAELMAEAASVAMIQMWDVDDWSGDAEVSAGLLNGLDTDGKPNDNFSGFEPFDVTDSVGPDGRPLVRETLELLPNGVFAVTWSGQEIELGGITLPADTVILVEGKAGLSAASGTIAVGIPVDLLLEVVVGSDPILIGLAKLAYGKYFDLDAGNAISAAFEFTSVRAKTVID